MKNAAQAVSKGKPKQKGFLSFMVFNLAGFLASMVEFYQEEFSLILDSRKVLLPPTESALGAGIIMAGGITIEQDLAKIKALSDGELYRYIDENIDECIDREKEQPRPVEPYGLWTPAAVEAVDQAPRLAGKSYLDVQEMKELPLVMNFAEYVRFARWHLWATGQPLDRNNATLTSSLDADGHVLRGDRCGVGFRVNCFSQHHSYALFRFREVVLP